MELSEFLLKEEKEVITTNKVPEISIDLSEAQLKSLLNFLGENVTDLSKVRIVKFGNRLMLKEGNEKAFAYIRLEKE